MRSGRSMSRPGMPSPVSSRSTAGVGSAVAGARGSIRERAGPRAKKAAPGRSVSFARAKRMTCIFVDRDYRRKGVAAVAVRGALDLIAKAGGGVVEGYPHDLQGEKMRSQFLYSATRSLFEELGFTYERPKGKKNCVMRMTVSPVAASRRARVG